MSEEMFKEMLENQIKEKHYIEKVQMFPPLKHQMSLAEDASFFAAECFLKMENIPYSINHRLYVESNLDRSRVVPNMPFFTINGVSENLFGLFVYEDFVRSIFKHNIAKKPTMICETVMREIDDIFTKAELYFTYVDIVNFRNHTYEKCKSIRIWENASLMNTSKRKEVLASLDKWSKLTPFEVVMKVDVLCRFLSEVLTAKGSTFYVGTTPKAFDALLYAHLYKIIQTELTNCDLALTVRKHYKLVYFVKMNHKLYFKVNN